MIEGCFARDMAVVNKIGGDGAHEPAKWKIKWRLEKFHKDGPIGEGDVPDEILEIEKNQLMYGGSSCIWESLIGNGTGTAGQNLTFFNNGNAAIGVGDSTAAVVQTQTDLQASSNKLRTAMVATYPQHTDGTSSGAASIVFQSQFTSGQANYAWNEVAVFNSATAATGRMLNRLQSSFGTKTGGVWSMTITISLS